MLMLLGVVACGEAPGTQASPHRAETRYVDANPDAPLEGVGRAQLIAALDTLRSMSDEGETELTQELALRTTDRIAAGDVLIGSIQGARGIDRWHMCKDYELEACSGAWPDDPNWLGDDSVTALLTDELDGYQWGNRLYFSFREDTTADSIAATLVHEVNHVLNRSECSYYQDIEAHQVDDTLAYVEEYRAFLTECFYAANGEADLDNCHASTVDNLVGYDLAPDLSQVLPDGDDDPRLLGELILEAAPEDGYGSMIPSSEVWPDSFAACSCVDTARDDNGYCRHANGRFAVDSCCE
jgi:hypothetical protein